MSARTLPHSLRDFVVLLHERFLATHCFQVAGSLTCTTLLALVPLITVTFLVFGRLPGMGDIEESLRTFLLENVLPDKEGSIITAYALEFSEKAQQLTLIGTVMLAVTSLMLLATIEQVFNNIWGVRQPRPLLLRITVYWFVLTLGPPILGGSIAATGYLVSLSMEWSPAMGWLGPYSARLLAPFLLSVLFVFLYYAVPNHKVRVTHALAGGAAAAVAFFLMQRAFGLFLARFPTYTLVYGTFAVLPIFLVWLYSSWVVVLLGALITATLPVFAERRRVVTPFPGCEAWAAVTILTQLARAQSDGRPISFEALREQAPLSEYHAEDVLGKLAEAEWVSRTDEGDWVLTRAPSQIPLAEIIRFFALDVGAWKCATGTSGEEGSESIVRRLEEGLRFGDETLAGLISGHGHLT
ncbi:MAG: YihY family inner membrane protein [Betaproteobacteria bacterium]|nr:YihY family inner membrane protein [Betaproteobacteria bacterium]